ncbi:acyltransferase family protein [Methylophaga thalassica]|uniref:acyltransferase family protein n=1 Tax=Methylophaga thalassica TaxID=40223 RepID=UPI00254914B7|nr:acyltransferase family protein [Methylophaga thalassica]
MSLQYRPDIDGLRFVAVMPVVLYHAGLSFPGGFIGVDIFFVISGYLLSRIVMDEIQSGTFSFARFYERRFRRLMPALFTMLAILFFIYSFSMLPDDFMAFAKSAIANVLMVSNFWFYNTIDYFSQSAALMPLLHTWSLAIEEQFYLVLPIFLIIASRLVGWKTLKILMVVGCAISFGLCIYYTFTYQPKGFYMPYTRAWELIAGALLHFIPWFPRKRAVLQTLSVVALTSLVIMVFIMEESAGFPGFIALAPVLATLLLLHTGAQDQSLATVRLLSTSPLVFVGKISYSLYLWHWPVMVFLNYGDLANHQPLNRILAVVVSFVLATLSWRYVEQPFRRKKLLPTTKGCIVGTVSAMGVAVSICIAIIIAQGFPQRVPKQILALIDPTPFATPREDCFPNYKSAITAAPCFQGHKDISPTFILIGDSHAFALSPALFSAAEEVNLSGLQYTSPGFFFGLGREMIGKQVDARIEHAEKIIAAHSDIRTIILSGAWADYATGTNWKGRFWLYQDSKSQASTSKENIPIFERALGRLFKKYPKHRFIVLDDVPAGSQLDLQHLARSAFWQQQTTDFSAYLPESEVQKRRNSYEPVLIKLAQSLDNVTYVPVFKDFCSAGPCPLFEESVPIYRDGDHLSRQGAMMQKPAFAKMVIPSLKSDHH